MWDQNSKLIENKKLSHTQNVSILTLENYKFDFHCLAKKIQRWLNICIFILVCSYIWLKLLEDDHHFLHVLMEYDYHFAYKQETSCNKH